MKTQKFIKNCKLKVNLLLQTCLFSCGNVLILANLERSQNFFDINMFNDKQIS